MHDVTALKTSHSVINLGALSAPWSNILALYPNKGAICEVIFPFPNIPYTFMKNVLCSNFHCTPHWNAWLKKGSIVSTCRQELDCCGTTLTCMRARLLDTINHCCLGSSIWPVFACARWHRYEIKHNIRHLQSTRSNVWGEYF